MMPDVPWGAEKPLPKRTVVINIPSYYFRDISPFHGQEIGAKSGGGPLQVTVKGSAQLHDSGFQSGDGDRSYSSHAPRSPPASPTASLWFSLSLIQMPLVTHIPA